MRTRSERGQVIIMFAVLVPIFLAMLAFVVDVGQMYLEHSKVQQLAESVARTIDKILSKDNANSEYVSAFPANGTQFEYDGAPPSDLSASAKEVLGNLRTSMAQLNSTFSDNIDLKVTFNIEDDTDDLYYEVAVSSSYKTIMKVASAASIDSTYILIKKFAKKDNKITALPD